MWMTCKTATFASALLLTAVAVAQEPPRRTDPARPPETTPQSGQQNQQPTQQPTQHQDRVLAAWLLVDNQNEIALSQLAMTKAQNEEVKQFARRMVEDHQKVVTKLQKIAGTTSGTPADASTRRDDTGRTGGAETRGGSTETPPVRRDPTTGSQTPSSSVSGNLDIVGLKQELGQKCLATARQFLEAKSGAEFDKCFMGMAVGAHLAAVDTIEVFRKRASGELKTALDEALPTVQSHLEHAKTLAQKCDTAAGGKRSDG